MIISTHRFKELINSENGENLHWTTDISVELPIFLEETGFGS